MRVSVIVGIAIVAIIGFVYINNGSCNKGRPVITEIKNDLKQIGTIVGMYYSDKPDNYYYPENPQRFEFDLTLLSSAYIKNSKKALPANWIIPNTWEEFNKSNSPFLFLRQAGEKYTEDANTPLFMLKKEFRPPMLENATLVLFEDGHVEHVKEEDFHKYKITKE